MSSRHALASVWCGVGAVLSHWAAAVLHGIIDWEDRYPDVLVLGESPPQHPRINGHRTSYLPREHITTVRGIPVTTADRVTDGGDGNSAEIVPRDWKGP